MNPIRHRADYVPPTLEELLAGFESRQHDYLQEPNPHRRRILLNYNLHAALELSGRWEEILDPALTVEQPMYEYFQLGISYHGAEAVRGFYSNLMERNATAILAERQQIAVADWGFCAEQTINYYMEEPMARGHGIPAIEGMYYVLHRQAVMAWHYDAEARLIGERVYHASHSSYSEIEQSQYLSTADIREILRPFVARARLDWSASKHPAWQP